MASGDKAAAKSALAAAEPLLVKHRAEECHPQESRLAEGLAPICAPEGDGVRPSRLLRSDPLLSAAPGAVRRCCENALGIFAARTPLNVASG